MIHSPEHIAATTTHKRKGEISHGFRYGVDYVLIDPDASGPCPRLFSRNRFNLMSVHDRDHGGPLKNGRGAVWAREVLTNSGLTNTSLQLLLLTQPRYLGYSFNPVSFWLALEGDTLRAVIAEVSTPFGDRHSYLCHAPDFAPITKHTRITTPKSLHVSPFQEVKGTYAFCFEISAQQIRIHITHNNAPEGVVATLFGPRKPLTTAKIVAASFRRPLGALRTTFLIYWQALRLKLKGATYRTRPTPPKNEVT